MSYQFWKTSVRTYNNLIDLSKQLDGLKNDIEELSNQKILSSRSYKIVLDYLASRLTILNNRFDLIQKDFELNQRLNILTKWFSFSQVNSDVEEKQLFELFEYIENEIISLKTSLGLEKQRLSPLTNLNVYNSISAQTVRTKKKKFLRRATERTG